MTARTSADKSWTDAAKKDEMVLGVPRGQDFEWFAELFKQVNPEVRITRIHTDEECVFHRIYQQKVLASVLPDWVPRSRDIFQRAGSTALIHLSREQVS